MTDVVARFEITFTRYLDEQGRLVGDPPEGLAEPAGLVAHYRLMALGRAFDAKAIALQRTGQLGTYASCLGQEAIGAAIGLEMAPEDVLAPSYREHVAQLGRGVTVRELLLYWGGDERGSDFAVPRDDFPVCVPIATQCTHAAGAAYAVRYRGESRAVVTTCGDGATSKGDFYEALNLAGVWTLPLVFVVSNNQWAISVPRRAQTAAQTLAQKAVAAGVEGLQVDGNDVVALRAAIARALEKARAGEGPTLIEALTYRLEDHTTADDASRYRDPAEVEAWRARDPLARLRRYLEAAGAWSEAEQAELEAEIDARIAADVEAYLATAPAPPESMFDHLHAELPRAYAAQRDALARAGEADG